MMEIKNYRPSKGFIWALFLVIFTAWIVYKCVPLTKKEQEGQIRVLMEAQNRRLAQEFDSYTSEDLARLPKFDSRKYALLKRNGRFWLIPREYFGAHGFTVRVKDIDKLIKKEWNGDVVKQDGFRVFMYSRQYNYSGGYTSNEFFSSQEPCVNKNYSFIWNGINIYISS